MLLRIIATAFLTLAVSGIALPSAIAQNVFEARCVFNADKSNLSLVVSNNTDRALACTTSCNYKTTSERLFQAFNCNYSLAANTSGKVVCDLDGSGPNHFSEVRPTRTVCNPR